MNTDPVLLKLTVAHINHYCNIDPNRTVGIAFSCSSKQAFIFVK
jgi:hypothetical protein